MRKKEAIRVAYGKALAELGIHNKDIVVLDADVSSSTQSFYFNEKHPERFYNFGIAEANMVSASAGLATMGKIPFVNTFSFLLCERALDQITSNIAYNNLNVKLAANYGGMSAAPEGASHHSLTDLAIIRSVPNIALVVISDAVQMRKALPVIVEHDGSIYFRLCRAETPIVHEDSFVFEFGKGVTLRDGDDITLIVTGILVSRVLDAAVKLEGEGISARVVEIHTIKPLDEELIQKCARETGAIVTCEEAFTTGGLGAAVCRAIEQNPVPVDRIGVDDCYTQSGDYEELLDYYGMSIDEIANKARNLYKRK
ncbi:MAG: transketolase family protein [Clostridiales bacterium]|nr:transketolase family protein [Clostridiales bacterium]